MKWQELQEKLIYLTKSNIRNVDFAKALNITRQSITFKMQNPNLDVRTDEKIKIAKYFNVSLEELKENKVICSQPKDEYTMDYYPEVFGSCGTGVFELSQTKEQIKVPKNALFTDLSKVKTYSVINAYGSSMSPFINDADKLIVEHWEGEQIIDNRVYVFCFDKEIFVKRLVKNINQLVIISDNKEYDTIKLTGKDLNKVHIIGQIVGLMRNMR